MNLFYLYMDSPVGPLIIKSNETKLLSIHFSDNKKQLTKTIPEILVQTQKQLKEYFEGKRKIFDLDIKLEGTDFQLKTWELVRNIPYGQTSTYKKISKRLGNKTFTRAVGMANAKNKLPIIIPCHRVIGTNGNLTGYAGGIKTKKWLLLHEQINEPKIDLFNQNISE